VPLAGFYYCPHHPHGSVPAYAVTCDCRKPRPGLILRAAREQGVDPARSWLVGDILDDVEAGRAAGCRTVLLDNGHETEWVLSPARRPDGVAADLAEAAGAHPAYAQTRAARGDLQPDLWGIVPTQSDRWAALRERVAEHGLRNSLLIAIAPTATIASIAGCFECVEPQVSNVFKRETLSGEFLQVNSYLVAELKKLGLWTAATRDRIKRDDGSVRGLDLPADVKSLFRTAWELPQRALIDLAAARGPYVDQSQSLNLFVASPTIGKLSSMYRYAWASGLKTTYYLRSRPATRIQQATVTADVCSLENPESCEACQ
jgi:ribonucleoside-diphosphate reductase alpha chain